MKLSVNFKCTLCIVSNWVFLLSPINTVSNVLAVSVNGDGILQQVDGQTH